MLKLYTILIFLCIPFVNLAQCPTGTITTQAQIDNFKTNYPACTAPGKNLDFELGGDVTNLDGLSHLTSIGGRVRAVFISISSISGLSNLPSLGGLTIVSNSELKNFSALSNLKFLGNLSLSYTELTSLQGLENLERLDYFDLYSNLLLSDLSALHHLPPPPRGSRIDMAENPLLSDCNFEFICAGVRTPPGMLGAIIFGNGPGCTSLSEVLANCGTLPVTLVNFKAKAENTTSNLTWSTSEETNSSYFEIQRSRNGLGWSAIGKVFAQGESKAPSIYNFTDKEPMHGANYYRLKMVDQDGTFAYSGIEWIKMEALAEVTFANPVENKLSFQNLNEELIEEISIYHTSGHKISATKYTSSALDVYHLSTGIYIASVKLKDGSTARYKFIKK
ncbi:T9SS type A sorting domain-containing protein [Dyadobacter sp.]|uniref:T9SS type A sorting domain-containing protein n=1 Tax=Dyadobacter sp. TaxID=1914288 RepID=UPI003F70A9FB